MLFFTSLLLADTGDNVPEVGDSPVIRSHVLEEALETSSLVRTLPLNPPNEYMVGVSGNCQVHVGGRLGLFVAEWQVITQDPFNFSVLAHGFQISILDNFPGVLREVTVAPRNLKAHLSICSEIQDLIQKNAMVEIDDFRTLCLSPIFVIPKKTGDLRIILNLKKINLFIFVQHFRMETLKVILPELCSRDWAVSIDLKDACLHVPIHLQSRRSRGSGIMTRPTPTWSFLLA